MKPISENSKQILKKLSEPKGFLAIFGQDREKNEALFSRLRESQEPAVIPYLLTFLFDFSSTVSFNAAYTIHSLLKSASPLDLIQLDRMVRERSDSWLYPYGRWEELKPKTIEKFEQFSNFAVSLFGLFSSHRNGYVREAALKKLANSNECDAIPFFFIRLNDWVLQIRELANTALMGCLRNDSVEQFVACLPLIERLQICRRSNQKPIYEAIIALLQRQENFSALEKGFLSNDLKAKRSCFRVALESKSNKVSSFIERGLKEKDFYIRMISIRQLSKVTDRNLQEAILAIALRDSFMPIRREALREQVRLFPVKGLESLKEGLLDVHTSIRSESRHILAQSQDFNFANYYRNQFVSSQKVGGNVEGAKRPTAGDEGGLPGPCEFTSHAEGGRRATGRVPPFIEKIHQFELNIQKNLFASIGGLGETGDLEDSAILAPFLNHSRVKIKVAAVRALSKLALDKHFNLIWESVFSESPRVSKEAVQCLSSKIYLIGSAEIFKAFQQESKSYILRHLLSLIQNLSKWESLLGLLKACTTSNSEISKPAKASLKKWLEKYNRRMTVPTKVQLNQIRSALEESSETLEKSLKQQIDFILGSVHPR